MSTYLKEFRETFGTKTFSLMVKELARECPDKDPELWKEIKEGLSLLEKALEEEE